MLVMTIYIMLDPYTIIYSWITEDDLSDLDGMAEEDDDPTFHNVVIQSLCVVRTHHTQELIDRLYKNLDSTTLFIRSRGISNYFAKLNKISLDMKKHGENVSESYLLHHTYVDVAVNGPSCV